LRHVQEIIYASGDRMSTGLYTQYAVLYMADAEQALYFRVR